MSFGGQTIYDLANDPEVRAALSHVERRPSLTPAALRLIEKVEKPKPASDAPKRRPLAVPPGTSNPKNAAHWANPVFKAATKKAQAIGHAQRALIMASLAVLGQRAANGAADSAAYDRLAQAVTKLEELRK